MVKNCALVFSLDVLTLLKVDGKFFQFFDSQHLRSYIRKLPKKNVFFSVFGVTCLVSGMSSWKVPKYGMGQGGVCLNNAARYLGCGIRVKTPGSNPMTGTFGYGLEGHNALSQQQKVDATKTVVWCRRVDCPLGASIDFDDKNNLVSVIGAFEDCCLKRGIEG